MWEQSAELELSGLKVVFWFSFTSSIRSFKVLEPSWWKQWLSAYLHRPCNAVRKCHVSENWFMEINVPVSELMSHSTMCLLSGLSCHEFRYLLLIKGLLLNRGRMLETKLQIEQMKNNEDPVGRQDSQNIEAHMQSHEGGLLTPVSGWFSTAVNNHYFPVKRTQSQHY